MIFRAARRLASSSTTFTSIATVTLVTAFVATGCKRAPSEPAPGAKQEGATHAEKKPTSPYATITFRGVWAQGPGDVWITGESGTIVHHTKDATAATPSDTTVDLASISGSGPSDIWAAGEKQGTVHFDGTKWSNVPEPPSEADKDGKDPNRPDYALGVWVSAPSTVWIAGLRSETGVVRILKDGKWEADPVGAATSLWAISASSPKDVWMVGNDQKLLAFVLHGDGKKFDRTPIAGKGLRAVKAVAPDDVWVGDLEGALVHWDGKLWSPPVTPVKAPLHAMWGSGTNDVWAVESGGVIVHWDGKGWGRVESGTHEDLWGIGGNAADDAWAVGTKGTVLHWDGKAWSAVKMG